MPCKKELLNLLNYVRVFQLCSRNCFSSELTPFCVHAPHSQVAPFQKLLKRSLIACIVPPRQSFYSRASPITPCITAITGTAADYTGIDAHCCYLLPLKRGTQPVFDCSDGSHSCNTLHMFTFVQVPADTVGCEWPNAALLSRAKLPGAATRKDS